MGAGFRRCYKDGSRQDPKMSGSVRVTAKVGPTGEVLSVDASSDGLSETVFSCVAGQVFDANFAPPAGGAATIVIAVRFIPD
jgi:hypothetical protein